MIPALLADTVATVVVADHSETRARIVAGADVGVDLSTSPTGRFELRGRDASVYASYAPLLTVRQLGPQATPEALQNWGAGASWRGRAVRISLMQSGSWGDQNYTYLVGAVPLPGQAAAPPQLLPGYAGALKFGSSQTVLSAGARAGKRAWLTATTSLYVGGGVDDLAKELIPPQVTPREEVALDLTASRRDHVILHAGASSATFFTRVCDLTNGGPRPGFVASTNKREEYRSRWVGVCRSDIEQLDAGLSWRRAVDRRTTLTLSAGGTSARSYLEGEGTSIFAIVPARTRFYPTGGAELVHKLAVARPNASRFEASARVAPIVDARLGVVDPRLFVELRNVTRAFQHASFKAEVDFSQTVPPSEPRAISLFSWIGEGTWALDKRFDVGVSVRGSWQRQSTILEGGFFSVLAAAFLEYHEPTLRLWP